MKIKIKSLSFACLVQHRRGWVRGKLTLTIPDRMPPAFLCRGLHILSLSRAIEV